jgi:hypothetical protein
MIRQNFRETPFQWHMQVKNNRPPLKIEFAQFESTDLQIWTFDWKGDWFTILNSSKTTCVQKWCVQCHWIDIWTRFLEKSNSGQMDVYLLSCGIYKLQFWIQKLIGILKKVLGWVFDGSGPRADAGRPICSRGGAGRGIWTVAPVSAGG